MKIVDQWMDCDRNFTILDKWLRRFLVCVVSACCVFAAVEPVFADTVAEAESADDSQGTDNSEDVSDPEDKDTPEDGDEDAAEPEPPEAVQKLCTTRLSKSAVRLAWEESASGEQYLIYRKTGSGSYRKIGDTEYTHYTDRSLEWNRKYHYKVYAVNEDGLRSEAATITYTPKQAVNISQQTYTYAQMKEDMEELAAMYSDYCTLTSVGTSRQGRQIYDLALGNPKAPESMLIVCTLHAREYICATVAMQQIEYYLSHYRQDVNGVVPEKLLDQIQLHYIVMANPDGVTISQTKNARWKSNANGVDLNCNFPASPFKKGGTKGSQGYSGPYALSEPESQAVAALTKRLIKKQRLQGVLNYHAMGQIIYADCSNKQISKDTQKMYTIAKKLTGYQYVASGSATPSHGGYYREYVMYKLGIPSITIEVGATTAPCAFWEYRTAFRKNRDVPLKIANALK